MLNAFPQGANNPDLLLKTYEVALRDIESQAIIDAAQHFIRGDVAGQNISFAPSIAQFVAEARKCQAINEYLRTPRLTGPVSFSGADDRPRTVIAQEKAGHANAQLPVLAEDIGIDQFRHLSKTRAIPTGAKWVACLGTIFGPPPQEN
jgi:hypothetical protein